MAETEITINI